MTDKLKLEYRKASELAKNIKNWKIHPANQRQAFSDLFDKVGWAGALLLNEATDTLVDGHMRRDEFFDSEELVPVLVGSWTAEQENDILAFLDPMAGMIKSDNEKLIALQRLVDSDTAALQELSAKTFEEYGALEALADSVENIDDIEFKEFDESVADEVEMITCPHCNEQFPK